MRNYLFIVPVGNGRRCPATAQALDYLIGSYEIFIRFTTLSGGVNTSVYIGFTTRFIYIVL